MRKAEYYEEKYGRFPTFLQAKTTDRRLKKVINVLGNFSLRGGRILDIGCGDGTFSLILKETLGAEEVYGIDISDKAVELARERGVKAFQIDIDEKGLPFEDDFLNVIFCGEIIEHLFDPDHLLDEIYRILRKGGLCILTSVNLAAWFNRILLPLGFQPYNVGTSLRHSYIGLITRRMGNPGIEHFKAFTERALKELLRIHKFTILKELGSCGEIRDYPSLLKPVFRVSEFFPSLASNLIFVLRK